MYDDWEYEQNCSLLSGVLQLANQRFLANKPEVNRPKPDRVCAVKASTSFVDGFAKECVGETMEVISY
jgi:hypothetical protein